MKNVEVKIVSASWCAPCKTLKPLLKGICEEHNIQYTEYDLDSSEGNTFASQHSVRSVPTVFVLKDGVISDTLVGSKSKQELEVVLLGG